MRLNPDYVRDILLYIEEKPFAIVLPLNVGNICFYDTNGNVVEYLRQQL